MLTRLDPRLIGLAVLIVLAMLLPLYAPWTKVMLTLALAKGLAVLGIVVLLAAGQVSFGHALFFAVSAYAAAFLGRAFGGGELITMVVLGVGASLAVGLVVGLFVVRYRYIFFGMLNLAFSMILFSILEKFYHFTGGSDGIQVARPTVLGASLDRNAFEFLLFYGGLVIAVCVALLVHRFLQSPLGNMMRTIASNETRLEYLGVSARGVLLTGYLVSAGLCGLGGVMMAVAQGIVTPEYTWWVRSGELVFIAILGGAHSVAGAFIGALVYEAVRTYASAFASDVWQMILGFFLLGIILYAPKGLIGLANRFLPARRAAAQAAVDDPPVASPSRKAMEPGE
ncbi:MAG: branched-chain amino acid ABC transporter permease [Pseudomonadota bacterium]